MNLAYAHFVSAPERRRKSINAKFYDLFNIWGQTNFITFLLRKSSEFQNYLKQSREWLTISCAHHRWFQLSPALPQLYHCLSELWLLCHVSHQSKDLAMRERNTERPVTRDTPLKRQLETCFRKGNLHAKRGLWPWYIHTMAGSPWAFGCLCWTRGKPIQKERYAEDDQHADWCSRKHFALTSSVRDTSEILLLIWRSGDTGRCLFQVSTFHPHSLQTL